MNKVIKNVQIPTNLSKCIIMYQENNRVKLTYNVFKYMVQEVTCL